MIMTNDMIIVASNWEERPRAALWRERWPAGVFYISALQQGSVSFKGSLRVPRFLGGDYFLLQYVDASLWNFSDHHASFRLQV